MVQIMPFIYEHVLNENLQDDEIDEMDPANCKYYDIDHFKSTKFNEILSLMSLSETS